MSATSVVRSAPRLSASHTIPGCALPQPADQGVGADLVVAIPGHNWSRFPDIWVHGDWAAIDDDGLWYILGRSDDTIKIAGKRLGPAEVESVLVDDPAVLEAAAIGVPDEMKGQALVCFVVLRPGHAPDNELTTRLTTLVID